jgi:hypothetical protein
MTKEQDSASETDTGKLTINTTCANNAGKGNKLVTVFEHTASYNKTLIEHHPDSASVLAIKIRIP